MGNLWDVTDKDIDHLTEIFLDGWLRENETNLSSMCTNLNKARNECKMNFLNGSAPIIYGLPMYFQN